MPSVLFGNYGRINNIANRLTLSNAHHNCASNSACNLHVQCKVLKIIDKSVLSVVKQLHCMYWCLSTLIH